MSIYLKGIREEDAQHAANSYTHRQYPVSGSRVFWSAAQHIFLFAGIALVATLLLRPDIGLLIMWNVLIPIAPALIVVAPGLWRNICPMATFSLLPRNFGFSRRKILPRHWVSFLSASGLVALLAIVPLRHVSLNTDGPMTALMLLVSAGIAFLMGARFEWRSGWCNTLCPIHPVEKLYGISPALTFWNARCDSCRKCVAPCPDSTRSMSPAITGPSRVERLTGHIMIGSFSGFIWGWYRLPDHHGNSGMHEIMAAYFWPFSGALMSLAIYIAARAWLCRSQPQRALLVRIFSAAAVSTYYWYRIPALTGFGPHPGTGMLCDLTTVIPNLPLISHLLTSSFFVWFLLLRNSSGTSWMKRPKPVPSVQTGETVIRTMG